jgi:hypothetical protein
MSDGPNGLLVLPARLQFVKCDFKDTAFDFYRCMSCLIQQSPHGAVALRRTRAFRLTRSLFFDRTHPYPRCPILSRFEGRCFGTHFGDSLHRVVMLLK